MEGWLFRAATTEDIPFTVFVDAVEGKVRKGRIPGAEVLATVPSGTEFLAFDEADDWYFVSAPAGATVWIQEDEALSMGGR